jgi:adenylate cyclase
MSGRDETIYRFGGFYLDTAAGQLTGPGGRVALRPKSMELLECLLRNAGRTVSKDDLLDQVWSGLTVTEDSLTQCIHDIRRALDDKHQAFVRTVPKRGYIFPIERLELRDAASQSPPISKVDARIALAVIPFVNNGSDAEHQYYAAGMTEDIIAALSRIGQLFVIAPAESYAGRAHSASTTEVAAELGARYVMKGSLRVSGGRIRVNVQLGDGATGQAIWAERFDGEVAQLFAVQDGITRAVALAVQATLTFGDLAQLWEGQTAELRAWEKMAQGRSLFLLFNSASNAEAQRVLREAITIDPRYTGALIQLGLCYWWRARYVLTEDKTQNLLRAVELAERALAIDPELGSAHMLLGGVAFLRDQHRLALQYCETAVALSPSDSFAHAYLGLVCSYSREGKRGIDVLKTALRLSPQPLAWYYESLSNACLWAGQSGEAIEMAEINFKLQPVEPLSYIVLASAYGFAGRHGDAQRAIADLHDKFPGYCMKDIRVSERYSHAQDLERVVDVLRRAGLRD